MKKRVLVIGGTNIDHAAFSQNELIWRDSNIGKITTSFGGVGRNIAENLARLGHEVTFLTAIGQDALGKSCMQSLTSLGIHVLTPTKENNTSSYLAIYDESGDMRVAVCDTEILDEMTQEDLLPFEEEIESFDDIVVEANLNENVLAYLFSRFQGKRFYAEAVSANKVKRLEPHLKDLYLFKSNRLEASYLLGKEEDLLQSLQKKGIRRAIVTDGERPILAFDEEREGSVEIPPAEEIVSTNGVGDALFAGAVSELIQGKDFFLSIQGGIRLARKTLASFSAVNPEITEEFLA